MNSPKLRVVMTPDLLLSETEIRFWTVAIVQDCSANQAARWLGDKIYRVIQSWPRLSEIEARMVYLPLALSLVQSGTEKMEDLVS